MSILEKGSFAFLFSWMVFWMSITHLIHRPKPPVVVYYDITGGPPNATTYWQPEIIDSGCSIDPNDKRQCEDWDGRMIRPKEGLHFFGRKGGNNERGHRP